MHHWTISIGLCLLLSLPYVAAILEAVSGPSSRTFISTASEPASKFSITQVKNPNWKPYRLSTTDVYAASFLKHKRPMLAPLRAAWNQSRSYGGNASTSYARSPDRWATR
jgi:hypothetical protein